MKRHSNQKVKFVIDNCNDNYCLSFVDIQIALNWLCAWLLEQTGQRLDSLKNAGKSSFEARNEIQIFYAKTLSLVFAQVSINAHSATYYKYLGFSGISI